MKITKQEIIDMDACLSGLKRFIQQTNGTEEPVEVADLIGGKNTYDDLLWLAGKKLPLKKVAQFAVDCAKLTMHLNDDPKVKAAIDAAQLCIDDPTPNHRTAAHAAARAARAAADAAARAAAYAADAAAYAAAYDADTAAYAADTAAYAAAAAYAATTADAAFGESVNQLLSQLFEE